MKRIIVYLLILILGISIGYALNNLFTIPRRNHSQLKKEVVKQIKRQVIRDTIIVERIINIAPSDTLEDTAPDMANDSDSTLIGEDQEDDNSKPGKDDSEEVIIQEKMIGHHSAHLNSVSTDSTDVEVILGVKSDTFSKEISIEFWQSPLNLTGYVLTRNKLKLFGFNPSERISLHLSKDKEHLFLNTGTLSVLLEKTEQFKNLSLK